MKLRSDAKNELTDRLRQEIGHRVTEALETDNAKIGLCTLSFQSTAYPERHVWVDTDLDGIGIDLEDWNIEEEWDNAVARIRVDSLEDAVEIIQIWFSGGQLDNYANVGLEYERAFKKLANPGNLGDKGDKGARGQEKNVEAIASHTARG